MCLITNSSFEIAEDVEAPYTDVVDDADSSDGLAHEKISRFEAKNAVLHRRV
jgi:hypothetical protein